MSDTEFMSRAVMLSQRAVENGQTPFGAVIVRDGEVIAEAHNTVWETTDPTAHGEVTAIRAAARRLGTIDLSDCDIYSSCEPCPMCLAAIHWAGFKRLVCGARIEDAAVAGFREMPIPVETLREQGRCEMEIVRDVLRDAAATVLREFAENHPERLY